jgi:molybdopterin molybdotransferase
VIPFEDARALLLDLCYRLGTETVALRALSGRVLSGPIAARRDQPPFAASAMDGYAVAERNPSVGDVFRVTGEAAAGRPYDGRVLPGCAVRIFTGAAVPEGTVRVVIQEDVAREGNAIRLTSDQETATHVRPAAGDFAAGAPVALARPVNPRDVALFAAMGHDAFEVVRRPVVAIMMTGDELRPPGQDLGPGEITASNGYGLAAMVEAAGAEARLLPIARDTADSLAATLALADGADLLLTVGGASVGDHDLVADALRAAGMDPAFHKVAMRPGKPLMAGRLNETAVVGLPGNPVSAMVCGAVFVLPMLRRMLGLEEYPTVTPRVLAAPVAANGPRRHFMRARIEADGTVHAAENQDSSLLRVLAEADCLIDRPPHDPARPAGEAVDTVTL